MYLHYVTNKIAENFIREENHNYAKKYIEDTIRVLDDLIKRSFKEGNSEYIDICVQELFNISTKQKDYSNNYYAEDSLKNVLAKYIYICKDNNNEDCSKKYFDFIKKEKNKINKEDANKILNDLEKDYKNMSAFNELKNLFKEE